MAKNALMILDTDPIIIHGITWKHVFNPMWAFGSLLKEHSVNFLASLSWSLLDGERAKHMLGHYHLYKENFPHHHVTILCNELPEQKLLQRFGMDARLSHLNGLLDPEIYTIQEGEKIYDAVINSRLDRWKRHILAKQIEKMALITYGYLDTPEEASYLKYLRRAFSHAHFPNYDQEGKYRWLSGQEISKIYAQSHTGLILSDIEGGCFAACEYLLSGIPVVSTENIGGRNTFLHEDCARIVTPTQQAVSSAVNELKNRTFDPLALREATIERMFRFKESFIEAWQAIYDREKVHKDARALFAEKYTNKMVAILDDHEVLPYLQEHGLCSSQGHSVYSAAQTSRTKFSIVVATYNASQFIRRCLNSLLTQAWPHVEIIVQDGGSTDGTVDILQEYGQKVNWVSEKDHGVYDAWNKAMDRVTGDWVLFLGADDFFVDENVLNKVMKHIDALPEHVLFAYGAMARGENTKITDFVNRPVVEVYRRFISDMSFFFSATFIRTQAVRSCPFDASFKIAGDYDFAAKLLTHDNLARLPVLISYMERGGLSTHNATRCAMFDERGRVLHQQVLPRAQEYVMGCMQAYWDEDISIQ